MPATGISIDGEDVVITIDGEDVVITLELRELDVERDDGIEVPGGRLTISAD